MAKLTGMSVSNTTKIEIDHFFNIAFASLAEDEC